MQRFVGEVMASFQTCLGMVLSDLPAAFIQSLEKMKSFLVASLEEARPQKALVPSKEQTQLQALRGAVATALSKHKAAADFQDGDPTLPLRETLHSLRWVALAYQMQARHPQESYRYWHVRNLMNLDKIFEQLYRSYLLVAGFGSVPTKHDFADVHAILQTIAELKKFDFAAIRELNVGITHH